MNSDAVHKRFSESAERLGELADSRRDALRERIRRFVAPAGDERVLDLGTGTGALAFAIAPLVHEVVGVDIVPEMLEEARKRAGEFPNVSFVEADLTNLPAELGPFDLTATSRTLHHVARPELALAELTRGTMPGGRMLVVDSIASIDPLAALELNRFERARDPSHTRTLSDADLRGMFEANGLVLLRSEVEREREDVEKYLDRAGCFGESREQALAVAPARGSYVKEVGWYLLRKPGF
jgi:ubiquinone/menaquinone biosynthesis C-methylase UbiE